MPDDVDRAQEREQEMRDDALADHQRLSRNGFDLPPCGECYGCGEPFGIGDNRLFCDGACADGYEHDRKQCAANGD